jgi:ABC-2 type transport system permease protein
MTTLARHTALLTRRRILEFVRQPMWVFIGISTPLLYLALFGPLLNNLVGSSAFAGGGVLDTFLPGILVLVAFSNGMGAGWIVIAELDGGVLERFGATPASRTALVLATGIRDALTFLLSSVLVMLAALPFGYAPDAGGAVVMLALLVLLTIAVSAWSSALGLQLKQIGSLAAVVTGLQLPLTLLSGILLPLSLAPGWMVVIAHANPLWYAVEASRDLSAGQIATSTVAVGAVVLAGLAVLSVAWSTRVHRRALG